MPSVDVILITAENYPAIFKAFEMISHDSGNQAGHINYAINMVWSSVIKEIEHDLAEMLLDADGDFECLCIGEEIERQLIVQNYRITLADKLLQEFFEEQ